MSDDGTTDFEEQGGPTAAEYVLGVLSASERRAAEPRIARDKTFAAEVAFWEERLGGLAAMVTPVTPPADGWARIEAQLDRVKPAPVRREGLWQSLAFWRSLAMTTSAFAAACLAALIYVGAISTPHAPLVAQLDAEGGKTGFVAAVNPAGGNLTIVPAASLSPEEQKALELWLIPAGEKPHSLGLIEPNRPVTISVPKDLLSKVNSEAVLAVSVEPPGGSPTGQPTGPVIANGKLAAL
ncbi:MAG: anti-sigma factor domain-containing protein [Actinomycetota bacterium]